MPGTTNQRVSSWPTVRLGDLADGPDAFADGPFGSNLKTEHYSDTGARVIRLQNIGRGEFLGGDQVYVPLDHFWGLERHHARGGDIVVAALGDGARPAGRACRVPDDLGPALVKADCFRVRLSADRIDSDYLILYLNSPTALTAISGAMRGATRPRVNLGILKSIPVPLPHLPEQKRIAGVLREQLDAAARMRAAVETQVAAAEVLVHSQIREAYHGVTPLSAGGRRASAPLGWRWHVLSDLARLESGHTPSRRHPEWWGGSIPWLALPDIRDLDCKVAEVTVETTNELGIANSSARVLPTGTVVLSRTASVGFVATMGRPMATSQDFVNWVCGRDLDPTFLMYLLRASRDYIRQLASGATHKTVYVPTVKAFKVCVPDVDEQRKIAARLRARFGVLDEMRTRLESQAAETGRLPAALLRGAFSGEL